MVTNFTDWNSRDSLEHYGIRGMKWGERRFQNPDGSLTSLGQQRYGKGVGSRSALGTKHDLNKLDRERATAKARYDYYQGKTTKKTARLSRKLERAETIRDNARKSSRGYELDKQQITKELGERGRSGEAYRNTTKLQQHSDKVASRAEAKAAKLRAKLGKVDTGIGQKARDYKALLDRNKKITDRIISESVKKGYSIYSRDCLREVNRGRNTATGILAAISAGTIGIGVGTMSYGPGTHYRVRNNGLGIQTHRSRRWGRKHNGL